MLHEGSAGDQHSVFRHFVQQKTVFVQYLLSKYAVLSEFAEQALNKN